MICFVSGYFLEMCEHLSPILHNLLWCGKVHRNTNQQRVVEKQQEIEDLSNVSKLEDAKQEKQHLTEENERLKQERAVKSQLSKQPGSYSYGHSLGTLSCVRYNVGLLRLPLSPYRTLSVDRQALVTGWVFCPVLEIPLHFCVMPSFQLLFVFISSFARYCLQPRCSHHFIHSILLCQATERKAQGNPIDVC